MLCSHRGVREKMRDNLILSLCHYLHRWRKETRQRRRWAFKSFSGSRFITVLTVQDPAHISRQSERSRPGPQSPRDNPIRELILKNTTDPPGPAGVHSPQSEGDNWNPFPSNVIVLSADHSSTERGGRGGGDHNDFLEMEAIQTVQFRSLSLARPFFFPSQSQPEH